MERPKNNAVAVITKDKVLYPSEKPYHPHAPYPEYKGVDLSRSKNYAYEMVREALYYLKLDLQNYGTDKWNPLSCLIKPGDVVFIKPNLIAESAQNDPNAWEHVITHGSVIRSMIDYVYIALSGEGEIIIGDSPQHDSNIQAILERTGISAIQEYMWSRYKFEIKFVDLREEIWIAKEGIVVERIKNPAINDSIKFSLNTNSYFYEIDHQNRTYYGAFYDINETNRHHRNGIHEYLISSYPIKADVFISLPKLKTHKKVGVTLNLKGKVGISTRKNWLPHYSFGSPNDNGDQYANDDGINKIENLLVNIILKKLLLKSEFFSKIVSKFKLKKIGYLIFEPTSKKIRSGNWYGNDTCWRMVLDLNKILLYGKPDGTLDPNMRKRYFSLVDGIIGMEGDGPVNGTPVNLNLIIAGFDPLNVDLVCTKLIGFDWRKIKMLYRAFDETDFRIYQNSYEDIIIFSNIKSWNDKRLVDIDYYYKLKPHFGWKGNIEL